MVSWLRVRTGRRSPLSSRVVPRPGRAILEEAQTRKGVHLLFSPKPRNPLWLQVPPQACLAPDFLLQFHSFSPCLCLPFSLIPALHPLPCTHREKGLDLCLCALPRRPCLLGPCCSFLQGHVVHHYYSGLSQKGWLCSGAKYKVDFGGLGRARGPKSRGVGEAPASSVWQVWRWMEGVSIGVEGVAGVGSSPGRPALLGFTEGLLLAAQSSSPWPSCSSRSPPSSSNRVSTAREGAEGGDTPGSPVQTHRTWVGSHQGRSFILAPGAQAALRPPPRQSPPRWAPGPEGPQRLLRCLCAGLLSLRPPGGTPWGGAGDTVESGSCNSCTWEARGQGATGRDRQGPNQRLAGSFRGSVSVVLGR